MAFSWSFIKLCIVFRLVVMVLILRLPLLLFVICSYGVYCNGIGKVLCIRHWYDVGTIL